MFKGNGKSFKAFLSIFLLSFSFAFAQDDTSLPNAYLPDNYDQNNYLNQPAAQTTQTSQTPAQISNGNLSGVYEGTVLSCPYSFERDLGVGSRGEDVRLLQKILNSDKRTIIALSGPGSIGKETTLFGPATTAAIKKFQALFIEYVGVANGRFGPLTRTVVNAICNGTAGGNSVSSGNVYNNVQSVQQNATPAGETTVVDPNDHTPPRINLSSNLNTVKVGDTFKVFVNFSEEVRSFTPDSVIIDGGSVKEIRKLSKTSYAMILSPNPDATNVTVQIEADKISDINGNINDTASNEVRVSVNGSSTATSTSDLDSLVSKIISSAPTCNYNSSTGQLITSDPTTGQAINTSGCPGTSSSQQATYDATRQCYSDTGTLPSGVTDTQRCSNPNNPNNSPYCQSSYQQQWQAQQQQQQQYAYMYGSYYVPQQNPCQSASAVANAATNLQQQQQQAQQQSMLGQLLGNLLGKGLSGLGSMGNNQNGNTNNGNGNTNNGNGNTNNGNTNNPTDTKQPDVNPCKEPNSQACKDKQAADAKTGNDGGQLEKYENRDGCSSIDIGGKTFSGPFTYIWPNSNKSSDATMIYDPRSKAKLVRSKEGKTEELDQINLDSGETYCYLGKLIEKGKAKCKDKSGKFADKEYTLMAPENESSKLGISVRDGNCGGESSTGTDNLNSRTSNPKSYQLNFSPNFKF